MKRNNYILVWLFLSLGMVMPVVVQSADNVCVVQSVEQLKKVVGKVSDEVGKPIDGACIKVEVLDLQVTTDEQGKFSLGVSAGQTLEVSAEGYQSTTLRVSSASTYSVILKKADEWVPFWWYRMRRYDCSKKLYWNWSNPYN